MVALSLLHFGQCVGEGLADFDQKKDLSVHRVLFNCCE